MYLVNKRAKVHYYMKYIDTATLSLRALCVAGFKKQINKQKLLHEVVCGVWAEAKGEVQI